jgi:hypothetical protein
VGTVEKEEAMSQAKIGRPKKEQTKPLIFERIRSRVTRPVSMSAKTGEDLDRYVAWAAGQVGAKEEEALALTMDQALGQFFQRDKLFQDRLDDKTERGNGSGGKPSATTGAPSTGKVSPPAPAGQPRAGVSS